MFLVQWIPATVNRAQNIANPDYPIVSLFIVHVFVITSAGFVNFLLYGFNNADFFKVKRGIMLTEVLRMCDYCLVRSLAILPLMQKLKQVSRMIRNRIPNKFIKDDILFFQLETKLMQIVHSRILHSLWITPCLMVTNDQNPIVI
jgi:hypothetical protein